MVKIISPIESLILSNQLYAQQWNALPESKANIPIFTDIHGKLEVATISIVECDGQYYFLTASHCLDESKHQNIRLEVDLDVSINIDEWVLLEEFDIAFCQLANDIKHHVIEHVKYMRIPSYDVILKQSTGHRHFFMVGFPASKNKKIKHSKEVSRYVTYLLEREDIQTGNVIYCSFNEENYYNEDGNSIQRHHSPKGNSGGPLIYVTDFEQALVEGDANFTFSGILIESSASKKNVLKFASAMLLRNILKQKY